jgi:hypothetical protein
VKILFDPLKVPMLGQRSAVDPIMARDGEWLKLSNLLNDRGKVYKRYGADLVGANRPFAGAIWRGDSGWVWLNNRYSLVAAFEETGTAVRLFSLNPTTYAWTEISNGTTQFSTGTHVQFAAMRDPGYIADSGGRDILLAGNGADDCRVITREDTLGTYSVGIASEVPFIEAVYPTSQHRPECWFEIKASANTAYPTSTGAFVTSADLTAGSDDNEAVITMDTTATGTMIMTCSAQSRLDANDYSTTTGWHLDTGFGKVPYVGILVEDTIADPVFNYLSVELGDATPTYRFVWSPATSGKVRPVYLPAGDGCYLAVFDMANYRVDLANYLNIDRMRWVMDHALPAARTVNIVGVYAMGAIPCASKHVVSYMNTTTFVESPGKVAKAIAGPTVREIGGNKNRNITLPEGAAGQNVCWTYAVRFAAPASGRTAMFYRKDVTADTADAHYYHTGSYDPAAATNTFSAKHDRVEDADKFYRRRAPSGHNVPPPQGGVLCASGRRMIVGRIDGSPGEYWASDKDYPLRFPGTIRDDDFNGEVDEDSGSVGEMPGETLQRILPMPNVYGGFAPLLAWTNAALWAIEGPDPMSLAIPGRLNSYGTIYPFTPAVHDSRVYYLDAEKQPRAYVGGRESVRISPWQIENEFETGDCWDATGCIFNGRYYIDIRAASATKKRLRVFYEPETRKWYTHNYTSPDLGHVVVQQTLGTFNGAFSTAHGSKQIAIGQEGYVWHLEKSGQLQDENTSAAGEDISIEMQKYIHGEGWKNYRFGELGVIWEESTNGDLTVAFNTPQDVSEGGQLASGTIDMDSNVPDEVWRYFLDATEIAMPGVESYGCTITITGDPTSGKALRCIALGVYEPCDGGGADAG